MTTVTTTILLVILAIVIACITHIAVSDAGPMVLVKHLEDDWTYRLPSHLKNNRYKGLSRTSYQLLALFYYTVKAIIIIALCANYCILVYILFAIVMICKKIRQLRKPKTTCAEQEDASDALPNTRDEKQSEHSALPTQKQADTTSQSAHTNRSALPNENTLSHLWNYGSETAWHEALDYYYKSLKADEQALDHYMENVNANEIAHLPVTEFYKFLNDKYFVWKYTAKNRLATTRKSLTRYADEDKMSELADIQKRLFSVDRSNIEKCLNIASEIHGLGPSGASGLLAILFPENFGTIDQYVVKALKDIEGIPYAAELAKMNPESLSIRNGVLLIQILREQAASLNKKFDTDFWTPRKIDMVLWTVGRVRN